MENWNECNCCYWVELSAWAENTVNMTAPGDYALIDKDAHHLLTVLANLKGSELVAIYQAMKELAKKEGRK